MYACKEPTSVVQLDSIPQQYIAFDPNKFQFHQDTLFYGKVKFSGYVYSLFPTTQDTAFVTGYFEGLNSGLSKKWYPNKQLLEERNYAQGKKNGKQVSYWENGNKRFEFTAKSDAYEGALRESTADGKLMHLAHFVNGQEEGEQKMWYDNGKIRANYVIRNGRRYGLLGTKNCKNVSDSIPSIK